MEDFQTFADMANQQDDFIFDCQREVKYLLSFGDFGI